MQLNDIPKQHDKAKSTITPLKIMLLSIDYGFRGTQKQQTYDSIAN